jgi:hypothetical protein
MRLSWNKTVFEMKRFVSSLNKGSAMKGMNSQNGVEFRIQFEGETWAQGDTLRGVLVSKPEQKLRVVLAEGIDKKVRSKSEDAYRILDEKTSDSYSRTLALKELLHEFNQRVNKDQFTEVVESVISEYRQVSWI